MKRYPEYRDNGIVWFPILPVHWKIKKIKHFSKTLLGGTPSTANLEYWENGSIPWLPSGMIKNDIIGNPEKFITEKGLKESATKLIKENTVLVAITGATCANIGYLKYQSTANQSVVAIQENKDIIDTKYLYYGLLSQRMQILIHKSGGAQAGVNDNDINNIKIPVPPKKEQTAIASFLDHKTQQIDDLIAKKQRLIELLKEERTAMINQSVTKGLDPNVPMKDSGIEWLGKIPEHWVVVRVGNICDVIDPQPDHRAPSVVEDGFPYIGIRDVREDGSVNIESARKVSIDAVVKQEESFTIKDGDIVFCKVGTLGLPRFIIKPNSRFALSATLVIIQNFRNVINRFLIYGLQSNYVNHQIEHLATGSTRKALGIQIIRRFYMPIPPKDEQISIAKYLDKEMASYYRKINNINKEIDLINEYKTSLINEAVTGKIDVRGFNHH